MCRNTYSLCPVSGHWKSFLFTEIEDGGMMYLVDDQQQIQSGRFCLRAIPEFLFHMPQASSPAATALDDNPLPKDLFE